MQKSQQPKIIPSPKTHGCVSAVFTPGWALALLWNYVSPGQGPSAKHECPNSPSQQLATTQPYTETSPAAALTPARWSQVPQASSKNHKADILLCVCKPQQTRLILLRGEINLHTSNLSFTSSASIGTPAAHLLWQNVDLLDLSCRRWTTITSMLREDTGTNTFLHGWCNKTVTLKVHAVP